MKRVSFFLIALFGSVLLLPANVLACACCADEGEYSIRTSAPSEYELGLLGKMKFDTAAFLYMNESDSDVKGLESIQKDFESDSWITSSGGFDLTNTFAAKTWKFNFKTPTGKTGTLTFPMPTQMVNFNVDIHDGKTVGAGGPLLYKEWRFKGNLQSGNGFFQAGITKPTTYFLVLQGRGNICDNAEDFLYWNLEITGRKANYRFFGKLTSGTSYEE